MSNDRDREPDEPVHYKSMFVGGEKDSPYLYACHLAFKDLTLTIDKVTGGEVVGTGGKKTGKPIVYWRERDARPLALNKTNGAQITSLYGTANVKEWKGKRVTLYPTTTTFGKDTVECIRVRPVIPPTDEGVFDLDDALAEIQAADSPIRLTECKVWLNKQPPHPQHKATIKAALERRAKQNDAESQKRSTRTDEPREPGSDPGE